MARRLKTEAEFRGLQDGETLEMAQERVSLRKIWHKVACTALVVAAASGLVSALGPSSSDSFLGKLNFATPVRTMGNFVAEKVKGEGAEADEQGVQVIRRLAEIALVFGGVAGAAYFSLQISRDNRSLRGIKGSIEYRDGEVRAPAAPQ